MIEANGSNVGLSYWTPTSLLFLYCSAAVRYGPKQPSSAQTGKQENSWLDFDPLYRGMGDSAEERYLKYRSFLGETISEEERSVLLGAVSRAQLTGGASFIDEIEKKLARRIELRRAGRPKKERI